jgi:hypothetical protein
MAVTADWGHLTDATNECTQNKQLVGGVFHFKCVITVTFMLISSAASLKKIES